MFRSNMTILCSALIGLMLIIVAVLVLFEDSFEQQFHSVSRTALERHGGFVKAENDEGMKIQLFFPKEGA